MTKSTTKKKSGSRKWLIIGLIAAIVILIIFAVTKGRQKPKGTPVTIEEASLRTIVETVSASGKIFPEVEVKISSDVSGEIVDLYVEEGDSVVLGQILAKIDPDTYISSVERSRASVNSAKAQWANSRSQIQSALAQKEQIQAQLDNSIKIHDRNKKLLADGVISQAEFETSLSNLEAMEANLRSSEASYKSAQESANGSEYSVKSAEANLKEMTTSLNRTTIKAPTSGIISSLSIEKGERVVGTIQMTGTEMMRIANLNTMEVQVDVSENDILKVQIGDEVDIEVDAYIDRKFKGLVTEIANSASNISSAQAALNTDQVTNFIVKVRMSSDSYADLLLKGKRYPFRPGMSASVDIFTEKKENALSIPIQAVTVREKDSDKKKKNTDKDDKIDEKAELDEVVFVMNADTVSMVKVTTDIQDDEYIIITSGLKQGDIVVSGPYSAVSKKLKQGDRVREKEEKEEEEKDSN